MMTLGQLIKQLREAAEQMELGYDTQVVVLTWKTLQTCEILPAPNGVSCNSNEIANINIGGDWRDA